MPDVWNEGITVGWKDRESNLSSVTVRLHLSEHSRYRVTKAIQGSDSLAAPAAVLQRAARRALSTTCRDARCADMLASGPCQSGSQAHRSLQGDLELVEAPVLSQDPAAAGLPERLDGTGVWNADLERDARAQDYLLVEESDCLCD